MNVCRYGFVYIYIYSTQGECLLKRSTCVRVLKSRHARISPPCANYGAATVQNMEVPTNRGPIESSYDEEHTVFECM